MEQETKTKEQQLRFTDLTNPLECVSLPVVWAWATHYSFPRKSTRGGSCGTRFTSGRRNVLREKFRVALAAPNALYECGLHGVSE